MNAIVRGPKLSRRPGPVPGVPIQSIIFSSFFSLCLALLVHGPQITFHDFKPLDCMNLTSVGDGEMSHVAAGWSFFNASDPRKALSESWRVLQPGGVLVASSWAETDWLRMLRTITKVDPACIPPSIPARWAKAESLASELEMAGYRDVTVHEVDVDIPFRWHESFVDTMMTKVTQMMTARQDLDEQQKALLAQYMTEEVRSLCSTEPGKLKAVSLVGVGVK